MELLAIVISSLSAIVTLYVRYENAQLELRIIERLNGKYVRSDVFAHTESTVERLRRWRDHDFKSIEMTVALTVEEVGLLRKELDAVKFK
jgi:hypothetical protein